MIPRPSPVKAHMPWMFTPAPPVAWPSRASSPGRSRRTTVKSLAIVVSSRPGAYQQGSDVCGRAWNGRVDPCTGARWRTASLRSMANRLASETSPYLLQHRDNPVDWYAWGEEAFARARAEDKPILVSIGYAACHWCHVMERESFEDAEVAAAMNERLICIKVDREERPDVDAIYMDAVQAMTGAGGWPLNAFVTPEGVPFYAGTYFPPEPRHGLPAWRQVVEAIADAWRDQRDEIAD